MTTMKPTSPLRAGDLLQLAHADSWSRTECLRAASEALRAAGHQRYISEPDALWNQDAWAVRLLLPRLHDRLKELAADADRPSLSAALAEAAAQVHEASETFNAMMDRQP